MCRIFDRFLRQSLLVTAFTAAAFSFAPRAHATVFTAKYQDDGTSGRTLLERAEVADDRAPTALRGKDVSAVSETAFPQFIAEHTPVGPTRIVTLRAWSKDALEQALAERGVKDGPARAKSNADEVVTLVQSGPVDNRIDLVFMGDGYTAAEREKFFADINRIVNEMFQGETFHTYLPVFNVHAVFHASAQSGIGKGAPQDTAYKLYREGDTLRAIYPGDSAAVRASCAAAPGCDYPIVIANDPYYGGLGGEIAISTSSVTSGTVVLRHEMGHTFGEVGEEYDAGGHFGANVASSPQSIGWKAWLTTPLLDGQAVPVEPMVARYLDWPWKNLKDGPFTASFHSDGQMAAAAIRFSESGIATHDGIKVTVDGDEVAYNDAGTLDRTFYDVDLPGFANGDHAMKFEETEHDGDNWVSSLTVYEYGAGYHANNDYVGVYPLFDERSRIDSYHSNHEACVMRNMKSTRFCTICKENNWLQFFTKVRMIDGVTAQNSAAGVVVKIATQGLGQFRTSSVGISDHLEIKWFKSGAEVSDLAGKAEWTLPATDAAGDWEVRVHYFTPEVKNDPNGLMTDKQTLHI